MSLAKLKLAHIIKEGNTPGCKHRYWKIDIETSCLEYQGRCVYCGAIKAWQAIPFGINSQEMHNLEKRGIVHSIKQRRKEKNVRTS